MYKVMILISAVQILSLFLVNVNFSPTEAHIPENAPNVVIKKMENYKVTFFALSKRTY